MHNQQSIRDAMEMWLTRTKFKNFCNERNGMSVLVVSDNHLVDLYFNSVFADCNCSFESISSGMQALAKIGSQSYDIVIIDEFIPDAGPFSLVSSIASLRPDLPVILATAPMGEIRQKARAMNVIGLEKPFIFKSVIRTLRKALLLGDVQARNLSVKKRDRHIHASEHSATAEDVAMVR